MISVNLTKEHLVSVITLIDIMTQRGSVRGEELLAVGQLRAVYEAAVKDLTAEEDSKTETPN